MDAVKEESYQILNWRNWEKKARERDGWRPRPALGCSAIVDVEQDYRLLMSEYVDRI
jgi:hypothetical protein